jgi:hypothetical protein
MNNRNYAKYFSEYRTMREPLEKSLEGKTAEQLKSLIREMFDASFIMGIRKGENNGDLFKQQTDDILGTGILPSAYDKIPEWSQMENAKESYQQNTEQGELKANAARTTSSPRCFNCGDTSHRSSKCDRPLAKCNTCKKTGHCTSMHEILVKHMGPGREIKDKDRSHKLQLPRRKTNHEDTENEDNRKPAVVANKSAVSNTRHDAFTNMYDCFDTDDEDQLSDPPATIKTRMTRY